MTDRRASAALVAAFVSALLLPGASALAQTAEKLEAEAKSAFDAGRFKEAAEKYAKAADSPDAPVERKADLYLNSAWAFYIAGNSKSARDNLKAAYSARSDLVVVGDLYSPDFARLAQSVRQEIGAVAPAQPGAPGTPGAAVPPAGTTTGGAPSPIEPTVNVLPLVDAADKSLKAGDLAGAGLHARRAADLDPRNAEARRLLGEVALAQGQEAEAERELTAAVALDAGNSPAELGLARLAERQRKWNTAASHYRRTLELEPRNLSAALGLGRALETAGDESEARIAYGRAIEIDPTSAEAHNAYGVLLHRQGDLDQALQHFADAVKLKSEEPVYRENLGRAYRKKGQSKEAERELAEAARLGGASASLWAAIGHLRAGQKNVEGARAAFASALEAEPGNEEAASGIAAVLVESGMFAEAEAALVRGIEDNPSSAVLWNDLGVVRMRRGDFTGAVEALNKALSLEKPPEPAKANLERARQLLALDRAAS